jgi:hypothetical protein
MCESSQANTLSARELLVWFLIVNHLMLVNGCTSSQQVSLEGRQLPKIGRVKILRVVLRSGGIVQFDEAGGRYVEKPSAGKLYCAIVGTTVASKAVDIDPNLAVEVQIEKNSFDAANTLLLLLGIPAAAVVIVYLFIIVSISTSKTR